MGFRVERGAACSSHSLCALYLLLVACGSSGEAGAPPPEDEGVLAALRGLALPRNPSVPSDASNRFADVPEAATFGQKLFFSPVFSGALLDGDNDASSHALGVRGDVGKVACAGCHLPESEFSDSRSLGRQISLAAGWGKRRAPSLLDVAQSKLLMWDGRRDAFYNQVFGVLESPVEMNSSRLFAARQVLVHFKSDYEPLFGELPQLDDTERFPELDASSTGCARLDQSARVCKGELHGMPGDGAEFDRMAREDQDAVTRVVVNLGKALGAYQRLLSCGESRFDRYARGEDPNALSAQELRGAELFVGKAKCVSCHSGPYFSDEKFHNVGLKPALVATVFIDDNDLGASAGLAAASEDPLNTRGAYSDGDDQRLPQNIEPSAQGAFRTPKLRCSTKRPSFMHTGQLATLESVVAFFDRGGDPFGYPGSNELVPLALSAEERADLVAFLASLDGKGPPAELLAPL